MQNGNVQAWCRGRSAVFFVTGATLRSGRAPVCFREAWVNSRARIAVERELADFLKALPPDSTLLMYLGNHVGALQQAGIPLRRVINEGNHRTWKQPVDLDGLWERALADPAKYADFVIAFEGDAVSTGARNEVQNKNLVAAGGDSCFGTAQGDDLPDSAPRPVIICVNLRPPEAAEDEVFR